MAPKKRQRCSSLPSPIPIGNCEVLVEAKTFTPELHHNALQISLPNNTKIKISVIEDKHRTNSNDPGNSETKECTSGDWCFVLVNPKDVGSQAKYLHQEVLNIYTKELPTMNYAANTGKQSMFLERCVSNGKYCTLLLKSKSKEDSGKVIAAITYQIIPADTQYAEVPLAAVCSIYQQKGIGSLLYDELRKRLKNVGIHTIFCWGDKESEGFWLKQGFMSIGEVDTKGRARRLPIKANIRRALSFPGGSTLMVSNLIEDKSANLEEPVKPFSFLKSLEISLPSVLVENHEVGGLDETSAPVNAVNQMLVRTECSQPQDLVKNGFQMDGIQVPFHFDGMDSSNMNDDSGTTKIGAGIDAKYCSCSSLGQEKRVWESSFTSLKSKKVKGGHQFDCQLDSYSDGCPSGISRNKFLVEMTPREPIAYSYLDKTTEECQPANIISEGLGQKKLLSGGKSFRIMLMNIADDAKKSKLSKIIEDLGGAVISDGSLSTHVVTGKVRKTLNFCTALSSGAWIISPSWIKESFREGRFVDEMPFILKDEEYELKYRTELTDAVQRARERPQALFSGYQVCLAPHLQPPVGTLSAIVRSAGGDVTFASSFPDMEVANSGDKQTRKNKSSFKNHISGMRRGYGGSTFSNKERDTDFQL
ncbi:uncharacterized protein LOC127791239 isoform X2 [Diospyros lotus]|uniref:uncharacterized protein LOC127791239 isoform X2 n=1 Tax=Diospyros lotus TaxID=55363 RepID=UPI0022597531|nr:uncharacterized protein LOC127791239 isoform X2 [Diospyros lotus]